MMYLAAFLCALAVDSIPFFSPPAWTILTVMIVKFKLDAWAVVALGTIGSTIGRWFLSFYIPKVSNKVLSSRENENVRFIGRKLERRGWEGFVFVLVYSLTPLSTTALFTAAGVARVPMPYLLAAFAMGKFTSDAAMVFTGKYAAGASIDLFHGKVSWPSVAAGVLGVVVIAATLFIDWKALLEHKKLRLRFNIWA